MDGVNWAGGVPYKVYGIYGISPNSGPSTGSTLITIKGFGFDKSKGKCRFGLDPYWRVV